MDYAKKRLTSNIEKLSQISHVIKSIYDQFASAELSFTKHDELNEILSITLKKENEIYLALKDELLNETFYNKFIYLINRSDLESKNLIINRVTFYIIQTNYINPFLSIEDLEQDRKYENNAIIECQCSLDYVKTVYQNLIKELEKTKDNTTRKKLIAAKYNLLSQYKILPYLIENHPRKDGRERCLIFKHNKDDVDIIFSNYCMKVINNAINNILLNSNLLLKEIELKSALALLTDEEIKKVAYSYYKATEKDPTYRILSDQNPNHQLIIDIIKSFFANEDLKIKQK